MHSDAIHRGQFWPLPSCPRPIVIIGTGDIVRDAHLPAYLKAGFPVAGVFDLRRETAQSRATEFNLPRVFESIAEAVAIPDAIFDLGIPPKAQEAVLEQLPEGAAVLSQKPMGNSLDMARRIVAVCERKQLRAAVNFQYRFCPSMLAIRKLVQDGELGELVEIDVRLNIQTPWETFPFLYSESRVEIQIHTIHYLDAIRMFLGEPSRVFARTVKHPHFPGLASTRSSIILDYGDMIRCCLSINHCHLFGRKHAAAEIRVEGTEGCAVATIGGLIDYPRNQPDRLEVFTRSQQAWEEVHLQGNWFPDSFMGTMSNLQRFAAGEDAMLVSPVSDALQTMKLVEACYRSDANGGCQIGINHMSHEEKVNYRDNYGDRLEKCYSGAVYDTLRAMGFPDQLLPQTIRPLDPARILAGRVFTVSGHVDLALDPHTTLLEWTKLLSRAPGGSVVVCQPNDSTLAHMGELSSETFSYRGVRGYIVDGGCRDSGFILKIGFRVWCRYFTPRDVVGRWVADGFGEPIVIGGVRIRTGDYVMADRDGVVVIPQEIIAEVTDRVEEVLRTENKVRTAILKGVDPVDAYLQYRKF